MEVNLQALDITALEFWMVSFSCRLLYRHRIFSGSHWIYPGEWQNRESNHCSADILHLACSLYRLLYSCRSQNKLQANKRNGQSQVPVLSAQITIRREMIRRACRVMTGNHLRLSMPAHLRGFGGLEVVCWPLVHKFAGSHPAEAVGFLGRKNPHHAFLRRGSKAVGPMS
jgi:hypothetical protein